VSIKYNDDVGRHGIAEQKINPGELVLIEEPLSWTVSVKSFPTACQGCVRTVGRTPFPSPNHPNAVFCCHSCFAKYRERLGSLDNLSLLEMFGSNSPESTNSVLLAFRAIIQQPAKFFVENRSKLFEVHDKEFGTKEPEDWTFEGTETLYRGLFNLVNHMEELTPAKEMETVIKSAVLLRFLISGGYFGPNPSSSGSLTTEQAFLGRLITIFQCGINYNQHGIYQAEGVIEAGKKLPIVDVGSAFYPNMVLFNHSCCQHAEDQPGKGLLHGRQAHHHAGGGGDRLLRAAPPLDVEGGTSSGNSERIPLHVQVPGLRGELATFAPTGRETQPSGHGQAGHSSLQVPEQFP